MKAILELPPVDFAHQIGAALAQDVGAVLVAEKIALGVEVASLHLGPDRAIAQEDTVGEIIQKMGHRATAAAVFGARTPRRWQIATIRSARFSV